MPILVESTTNPASTVTLDALFLNDAEDPSDFRTFAYVGDSYQVRDSLGGGVESGYASGRSRAYATEDDTTTVSFTAANLTGDDLAWLKSKRGRVLCFRDFLGRKVFGMFHDIAPELSTAPAGSRWALANTTAQVTLQSVTFDESV